MWGVFVSFAVLGWRYNSVLIIKGVLISLGVSLIVRAFLPKEVVGGLNPMTKNPPCRCRC